MVKCAEILPFFKCLYYAVVSWASNDSLLSSPVREDLFTMSQMNYLLKINMIYICPPGLPHDVMADLTFHFIVAIIDALQIFACCGIVEHFQLNYDKSTDISQR